MNKADESSLRQYRRRPGRWVELAFFLAGAVLVNLYGPFAHVFGIESFEARHPKLLVENWIYVGIWIVGKTLYLVLFRRAEEVTEFAAVKQDLLHGRVKRMSLAARC